MTTHKQTDKRQLRLHTIQRYAQWTEPYGSAGGPVIELEVGYLAASALFDSAVARKG